MRPFLLPVPVLLLALFVRGEDKDRPAGRRVYRAEACWQCHVHARDRAFPVISNTRRTGPVIGKIVVPRSREWHLAHFFAPRALSAESQMPAYPRHFTEHENEAAVRALVQQYDRDGDGIVTRAEHGDAGWPALLKRFDTGNEVISMADAVPRPSDALERLIEYLPDTAAPPPFTVPARPAFDPPSAIARGEKTFQRLCAGCHGMRADGNGPMAMFFGDHPPRDFRRGEYKFRSTIAPDPPLDVDLFRSIRRGLGGSMPAWPELSHHQVWDLVEFLKSNHPGYLPHELVVTGKATLRFDQAGEGVSDASGAEVPGLEKRAGRWWWKGQPIRATLEADGYRFALGKPVFAWMEGFAPTDLVIPEAPFAYSKESAAIGAKVYEEFGCANCHGPSGRGDGPAAAQTRGSRGEIIVPTDYTRGFLGGGDARSLVRSILTGLHGTPMPSYVHNFRATESADPAKAPWHLAHYLMLQSDFVGLLGEGRRRRPSRTTRGR